MRKMLLPLVAALPLVSGGCVAKAVWDVATLPVKATSQVVDWGTTSQEERDRNLGRKLRKEDARRGREARKEEARRIHEELEMRKLAEKQRKRDAKARKEAEREARRRDNG